MTFDTANLQTQAQHYATLVLNSVDSGRNQTLTFLNNNLPTIVTEQAAKVGDYINSSAFNESLKSFKEGVTPALASAATLGCAAGSLLVLGRPLSAATLALSAVGLTKDISEITTVGIGFLTGFVGVGCISLTGRAKELPTG